MSLLITADRRLMNWSRTAAAISFATISGVCVIAGPIRVAIANEDPAPATQPAADTVDYHKLKDILPDAVAGLKRKNAEGTKQAMGEVKMSQADGTYSEDGKDGNAKITIMDYGAMPGMAAGMAPWASMDIDNDSDTEYTKSVTISGIKGLETYNKTNKNGSLVLMVGGRFLVSIEVNTLPSETLKAAAEAMKLSDLAALK